MKRLIQIEWLKLKHYRPFWILTGLYTLLVMVVTIGIHFFLAFMRDEGASFNGFDPTMIPLYDFPDIWQNFTYIAGWFKLFLAFLVIISVSNELNFRTLKQNIIDGMSKWEWLKSKLLLIITLGLLASVLLLVIGLLTGMVFGHPHGYPIAWRSTSFLFAYFLEVVTFLTFALLLILIIRRSGLVIVGLMMYTLTFEPLLTLFLENFTIAVSQFRDHTQLGETLGIIASWFPIRAINNLIHRPFDRYFLREIQDFVSFKETFKVLIWLSFNIWASLRILKRRDL